MVATHAAGRSHRWRYMNSQHERALSPCNRLKEIAHHRALFILLANWQVKCSKATGILCQARLNVQLPMKIVRGHSIEAGVSAIVGAE